MSYQIKLTSLSFIFYFYDMCGASATPIIAITKLTVNLIGNSFLFHLNGQYLHLYEQYN